MNFFIMKCSDLAVQNKTGIDIRLLGTGRYYVTNSTNLPTGWVAAYLDVERIDNQWCRITAWPPYDGLDAPHITKQCAGTWKGWQKMTTDSDIAPINSQYVGNINDNIPNKVNLLLWDSNTVDTPFKTGQTIHGNGFCITLSTGSLIGDDQWLCQLLMAVGDSHLFTRHRRAGVWSAWTAIGSPVI